VNTTRAVVGAFLVLGALIFIGTTTASGQDGDAPYQPAFGDLIIEGTDFTVGTQVVLSGDGFRPEAPVQLTVRPNDSETVAADSETEADGDGAVRVELMLSDDFAPGSYTATVMGPAIDGAVVQLSGVIVVYATPAQVPPTPVPPTTRPAPIPTTQAPVQVSPTPTPLPEVTVSNEPPPTTAVEESDDGATVPAETGDSTTSGAEQTAADGDSGVTTSDNASAVDESNTDEGEVAASAVGDAGASSGGWGALQWMAVLGALVLIIGALPVLWHYRTAAASSHEPAHSDD
jgi:hypothetical protein